MYQTKLRLENINFMFKNFKQKYNQYLWKDYSINYFPDTFIHDNCLLSFLMQIVYNKSKISCHKYNLQNSFAFVFVSKNRIQTQQSRLNKQIKELWFVEMAFVTCTCCTACQANSFSNLPWSEVGCFGSVQAVNSFHPQQ